MIGKFIGTVDTWKKNCDCSDFKSEPIARKNQVSHKSRVKKGKTFYEDEIIFTIMVNPNPCCTLCGKQWKLKRR